MGLLDTKTMNNTNFSWTCSFRLSFLRTLSKQTQEKGLEKIKIVTPSVWTNYEDLENKWNVMKICVFVSRRPDWLHQSVECCFSFHLNILLGQCCLGHTVSKKVILKYFEGAFLEFSPKLMTRIGSMCNVTTVSTLTNGYGTRLFISLWSFEQLEHAAP